MLKKTLFTWLIYCISFLHYGYAQSSSGPASSPNLPPRVDLSIPSPTVASLGKFGLTPVSYYTGVPQVSIPIWEMKGKTLRLPISLNYNNNGLKIAEDASWVGLGWGLQAGGIITEMVRGLPDSQVPGVAYTPVSDTASTLGSQLLLNRVAQGYIDGSPDIYVFNFSGHSGQFILYQNKAYQITHTDLKIEYDFSASRFTITTGDGTIYKFFKIERTTNIMQNGPAFGSASWLLTEIVSADGSDSITLTYATTPEQYTAPTGARAEDSYEGYSTGNNPYSINAWLECRLWDSSTPGQRTTFYSSTTTAYRLSSIDSPLERIEFIPQAASRLDVNGTAYALSSIRIYDKYRSASMPIRSFNLQQGYFTGGNTGNAITNPEYGRLKLQSIQEVGEAGLSKPAYLFEYQDGNFPGRLDRSVDHWGFYNASGNTSFIPATLNYPQGTANRNPNFQATQLGTLQKVTYPTGGFEAFTYEQNRFYPSESGDEADGPGLRVSRITTQSATGQLTYRNFTYTPPINGRLIPQYEKTITNNPGTDCDCLLIKVSGNNPDVLSIYGSSIMYNNVVESLGLNGEGGRTEYEYEAIGGTIWSNEMRLKRKTVWTAANKKVSEETSFYGEVIDIALPTIISSTPAFGPYALYGTSSRVQTQLPGTLYHSLGCIKRDPNCGGSYVPELEYKTDPNYGYTLSVYYPSFIGLSCVWAPLIRKQVRTYDQTNTTAYTELITRYYYDQGTPTIMGEATAGEFVHRYLTREEFTDSQGRIHITRRRYPQDYNTVSVPGTDVYYSALRKMTELHQVDAPVEQMSLLKKGNTTTVLGGQLTLFKAYTNAANIQAATLLKLETTNPLPDATYSTTTANALTWNNHFTPYISYDYDELGNPRRVQPTNGAPTSYLWGYSNTLMIAEVKNASPAQIAYTSFEADSPGSWTYDATNYVSTAFTGTRGYGLGGSSTATMRRTGLLSGSYELLLWAHGTGVPQVTGASQQRYEAGPIVGDWHQHRYYLALPANASLEISTPGYIWIDEVRLHPMGAQMTSYTHAPLTGITSQTDPNGRTMRYEYDGLQRLNLVRDQELNIVQKYDYHYKP